MPRVYQCESSLNLLKVISMSSVIFKDLTFQEYPTLIKDYKFHNYLCKYVNLRLCFDMSRSTSISIFMRQLYYCVWWHRGLVANLSIHSRLSVGNRSDNMKESQTNRRLFCLKIGNYQSRVTSFKWIYWNDLKGCDCFLAASLWLFLSFFFCCG